ARHYETVLREADRLYDQGGDAVQSGLNAFDSAWANIQVGLEWVESRADEDNETAALSLAYQIAGPHLLDLRLHPRERIQRLNSVLATARRLNRRESEAYALGHLGVAYADLGETLTAIEFHKQALAMGRQLGNRGSEANALGNLGLAYR